MDIVRQQHLAELKKAKDMLDLGLITEAEYEEKKAALGPIIRGETP